MKNRAAAVLAALLLLLSGAARAEASDKELLEALYVPVETLDVAYTASDDCETDTTVLAQQTKTGAYLFLPATADLTALTLTFSGSLSAGDKALPSGEAFDLTALTDPPEDGEYALTWNGEPLTLMRSANLPSLYLCSDDPDNMGRRYVETSVEHADSAPASMALLDENGARYDGPLTQLRGRGNTTWTWGSKKPYQIKLDKKTSLLAPDDPTQKAKKWLLLADAFDATLLRNTLALSLAKAFGFPAPDCAPVDLYYDGVYRGTYLLCEKVEVGEGRLDLFDYDKYIEKLYPGVDDLPTAQGISDGGLAIQYVDGLETASGDTGAYLIEQDSYFYQKEKSWFITKGDMHFALITPECASQADVSYISGLVQRVEAAIMNGGVDPASGRPLHELLDLDGMARFWLLSEFTKNPDYWYASTYFYKPEGTDKLYVGPAWDFDISCAVRDSRANESGEAGYIRDEGWIEKLVMLPAFQEAVKRLWAEELAPLVKDTVLGDKPTNGLQSLIWYQQRIDASRRMNFKLWEYGGSYDNINDDTLFDYYEDNFMYLSEYLTDRLAWMDKNIAAWSGAEIEAVDLTLCYRNADIAGHSATSVIVKQSNAALGALSWQSEKDGEAPGRALYTVHTTLTALDGCAFADDLTVTVNGGAAAVLDHDEKTASVAFRFSAPYYEPALYEGVDYGLIYNYDYFVAMNPDEMETLDGDDPETVLADFAACLGSELPAIETYDSQAFIANYEKQMDSYFMCDPESCALYYIEHCFKEDLLGMAEPVYPQPLPME